MADVSRAVRRITEFLADESVVEVFTSLRRSYFESWTTTTDPSAREELWAKCRALDDLGIALQAVADAGEWATSTPQD